MNESTIKPISSRSLADPSIPSKELSVEHAENVTSHRSTAADLAEVANKIKIEQGGTISNVSIHFRLDDKTNELTVFVVDRKTKRVLRSIPASELHKLQSGDLLKLTA